MLNETEFEGRYPWSSPSPAESHPPDVGFNVLIGCRMRTIGSNNRYSAEEWRAGMEGMDVGKRGGKVRGEATYW